MNKSLNLIFAQLACLGASALLVTQSQGDPLPGRDLLKFNQQPMISNFIGNTTGGSGTYYGHDELSTAYGIGNAAQPPASYDGIFMADDFADKLSSPVLHVKWWGSYLNNSANQQPQVQKFLVAFESDVPVGPGQTFSRPGNVLSYDVLTRTTGPLTASSGQFTEKQIRGPDPILGEALYEYNGELNLGHDFPEVKDTVYWLKIVALVDTPTAVPIPPPPNVTQWGWHNRDYTTQDPLASAAVAPGEVFEGTAGTAAVYHFQDDAVSGNIRFIPSGVPPTLAITQNNYTPKDYLDLVDGAIGIGGHSKDLAFQLFTFNNVPEPGSFLLMAFGVAGAFATRRRSQVA